MLGAFASHLYANADRVNRENILRFARGSQGTALIDLGCDDGDWTAKLANEAGAKSITGVEINPERARLAESKGVKVRIANLGSAFPFDNAAFDLVHANQVIEHVPDIDLFLSEIFRILKPGGCAIVSTENGSSWVNVFAAAMGWQIFSLTNVSSKKLGIGNPLALHRHESGHLSSWTHKTIFNYRGFAEIFAVHGFEKVQVAGAGYFPLFSRLGRLDPRHAHFITACAVKPN